MNRRYGPPAVYFVRRTDGEGPIKIGCSEAPETRLAALMTWSPYPLEIIATIPGDEVLERRFHAAFADAHSHREWFAPTAELLATIEAVRAGTFDPVALPAPSLITFKPRGPLKPGVKARLDAWNKLRKFKRQGGEVPSDLWALINRGCYKTSEEVLLERAAKAEAFLAEALASHHAPLRKAA